MLRRVQPAARVVHTATRQVYGRPLRAAGRREHPAHPVDVNGVAKLAGEQLHLVYAHAHAMRDHVAAPDERLRPAPAADSDELGFLPVFIRKALLGETIEMFGDGSQRRDCLYVDDVVDAILAATDDAAVGRVFNVGNDIDHSLAEIADDRSTATGSDSGIRVPPWPTDHQRIDIGSFQTDSSADRRRSSGGRPSPGSRSGMRRDASLLSGATRGTCRRPAPGEGDALPTAFAQIAAQSRRERQLPAGRPRPPRSRPSSREWARRGHAVAVSSGAVGAAAGAGRARGRSPATR